MKVRLTFTVSDNALPALVTVRTMGGKLVLFKKVYERRNVLCFCAESGNLIITVKPFNADYYEKTFFVKCGDCGCVKIRLFFDFTDYDKTCPQIFYLYDGNYFFPIEKGNLLFSRKNYRL